ncbi:MAG: hypothetical protein HY999_04655 [Nitrospinae bacterium]|nr:hypothetical protein [Nitrospinota bacterium]
MFERERENSLERLSRVITEAIIRSEEVKKILSEIKNQDIIYPESFMILVIRMESLVEIIEEIHNNLGVKKKRTRKDNPPIPQYIDGKKLTDKEIVFEEYYTERFNEDEWLKNNGLIF